MFEPETEFTMLRSSPVGRSSWGVQGRSWPPLPPRKYGQVPVAMPIRLEMCWQALMYRGGFETIEPLLRSALNKRAKLESQQDVFIDKNADAQPRGRAQIEA